MRRLAIVLAVWSGACSPAATPASRWPHHRAQTDELVKQVQADRAQLAALAAKLEALRAKVDASLGAQPATPAD